MSDVWGSYDGIDWFLMEPLTKNTAFKAKVGHSAVVLGDNIVILGGGNGGVLSDELQVSPDGKKWTSIAAKHPLTSRMWHTAVVFKESIVVAAGWDKKELNDVIKIDFE